MTDSVTSACCHAQAKSIRSRHRFCTALMMFAAVTPLFARATKPPVTVEVAPETVDYRTFPKGQPPGGGAHFSFEKLGGYCDTQFAFECTVFFETPSVGFGKPRATITRVEISASLATTIWLEEGSDPGVLGHEESHRAISNHYYAMVDSVARQLATPLIGRKIVMPSRRIDPTDSGPIEDIQQKLIEDMGKEIVDRCDDAQHRFDCAVYRDPPGPGLEARKAAIDDEALDYAKEHQSGHAQD